MAFSFGLILIAFVGLILGVAQIVAGGIGFASTKKPPFIVLIVTGGLFLLLTILGVAVYFIGVVPSFV